MKEGEKKRETEGKKKMWRETGKGWRKGGRKRLRQRGWTVGTQQKGGKERRWMEGKKEQRTGNDTMVVRTKRRKRTEGLSSILLVYIFCKSHYK